ncbi:MAG: hypothetical protein HYV63_32970 [Candidatus Schekmanbacteria bacterium]|nr:hypothetical protein [Candidatus Schekmanbacteria bacterium]
MGKAVAWFLFCLALIIGPFVAGEFDIEIGVTAQLMMAVTGIALLVGGTMVITLTKLYMRTKANEAFVRTGKGGARVILDGGAVVIPVIHEVVRVPLETLRLDVDRTGADALITEDKLRADLKAEFYIRVQPNQDDVLNAARSLGEKTFNLRDIEELVRDKLVSTLRAVAATRTLDELNAKREEFAAEVKRGVEADLRHNGLTLETVTVSKLDQTDHKLLNTNNVFDAQGLRRIAEITQEALVRRNLIERDAERLRTEKDVDTRQKILELERSQAAAEAGQRAQVARVQAERASEAKQAQIEQEQIVLAREVEKKRFIEQQQILAQRQLIDSRREQELVEVDRVKAVETANRDKLAAIAEAEARRAQAERLQFDEEAQRAQAEQRIITVEVTAQADREGEQKLIAAKKGAEEERYRKQVQADIVAYTLQKEAEGKKAAAEAEYHAKVRQAEADSESARRRAEGETALQMVSVNVEREKVLVDSSRVDVEQRRVEVEAQALQNREKYSRAALEFELEKSRIQAQKETQVSIAGALGEFFSQANFNIYGDPESAQRMLGAYLKGMGLGRSLDGFLSGTGPEAKKWLGTTSEQIVELAKGLIDRAAGGEKKEGADGPGAKAEADT